MERKKYSNAQTSTRASKSINEIRKDMAEQRENELRQTGRGRRAWEDDERTLMDWARERGGVRSWVEPKDGPHSYSAPVLREDIVKRERQNEYRLALEAQMREKNKLKDEKRHHQYTPPKSDRYIERDEWTRAPPIDSDPNYWEFDHFHEDEHRRPSRYVPNDFYHPPYDHMQYPYPSHAHYYYPPYVPHPPPPIRGPYYPPPPPLDMYTANNPYMFRNWRSGRATPPRSHSPQEVKERKSLKWKEEIEHGRMRDDPPSTFQGILDQQMKEKRERERFIKKMEEDTYDPWGRPGGGAPLTDATGNLVTERGLMRKSFDESTSPRLTEEEKKRMQQQKQKDELEKQMKEREEQKLKEKLLKQQEDEIEEKRIVEETEKLRLEGLKEREKEKEKEKEKEEKKKIQNEPLLSKQEIVEQKLREELEKKKRKQQEEEERIQRLADKMAGNVSNPYVTHHRQPTPIVRIASPPKSPPIPTLRGKPAPNPPPPEFRYDVAPPTTTPPTINEPLPPVHVSHATPATPPYQQAPPITRRTPPLVTTSSSPEVIKLPVGATNSNEYILQNLSALKDQLRRNHYNTDSTTSSTSTTGNTQSVPIRLKPTIPKRQQQEDPPHESIDTFNSIKYSNPTSSRLSFWKQYPAPPKTRSSLEIQQDALLQHQKERIESKTIS